MKADRIDGPAAFDLPQWQTLLERDPHPHIFATPQWGRLWWDHFGEGKELRTLLFADGEAAALASLVLDTTGEGRRLRFNGGDDLTDYMGPLVASEAVVKDVADSLLGSLLEDRDWDFFDAKCLPVPFHFAEWMVEAADRMDLVFKVRMDEMTAVLPLPGDYRDYLGALPGKKRHELRRKLRRFHEKAPAAQVRSAGDETIEEDLQAFVDMHRGSEG
ncbi:MAG: GNAT family N-acetyltransferase, partial [Actinomycetota bacterium]